MVSFSNHDIYLFYAPLAKKANYTFPVCIKSFLPHNYLRLQFQKNGAMVRLDDLGHYFGLL